MWEVLSFGDKPYGEMSNQEVSLGVLPMPPLTPCSSPPPVLPWPLPVLPLLPDPAFLLPCSSVPISFSLFSLSPTVRGGARLYCNDLASAETAHGAPPRSPAAGNEEH